MAHADVSRSGGGFSEGGSADRRYNGSWIVEQSVQMGQPVVRLTQPVRLSVYSCSHTQIFASLNYRVLAFGFLYGNEVAAEKTGNFGLLDQVPSTVPNAHAHADAAPAPRARVDPRKHRRVWRRQLEGHDHGREVTASIPPA
jgi:hypothetical protein